MLIHDARRAARFDGDDLVLLADQDRTKWDHDRLARGRKVLTRGRGPYAVQAAIASLQCEDPIDWPRVAVLYAQLPRSPVVELNRAVAIAEAGDVVQALAIVDALDLDTYRYLHSTRAELLTRLDRRGEAADAYRRALALDPPPAEQRFLTDRLDGLDDRSAADRP